MASDLIKADMVEAIEFPQLANKYSVQGVPRTVINETVAVEGAVPEPLFVARVLQAVGMMSAEEVDKMLADLMAQAQEHEHDHDHEH